MDTTMDAGVGVDRGDVSIFGGGFAGDRKRTRFKAFNVILIPHMSYT
jgi:hypothetical protein